MASLGELEQTVVGIIAEKARLDPAQVTLESKLTELNIASLDVVEIIFALEDKFDIQIPYNANNPQIDFGTVGAVVEAVRRLIAAQG
jgi:acyl carrier protein